MSKEIHGVVSPKEVIDIWLDFCDPEIFLVPRTDLERLRLLEKYGFGDAKIQILDEGDPVDFVPHGDDLGDLLAACGNYLMIPTYTDCFQFHGQRREWRRLTEKFLGKDYRRVIDSNRIRLNHFLGISKNLFALMSLVKLGKVNLPKKEWTSISRFERGVREHCVATHCYDDLGAGYKVMLSQTTAEACRNLLTELNLG